MNGPTDLPLFVGAPTAHDGAAPVNGRPASPQARRLAGHLTPTKTPTPGSDSAESPAPTTTDRGPATTEELSVDRADVQAIRTAVSTNLDLGDDVRQLTADKDGERARTEIISEIQALNQRRIEAGTPALPPQAQAALAQAVFDALFGLGPLQPHLDRPGLKNLLIRHGGVVWLKFDDGRIESAPPVTDSPQELITLISNIAASAGMERPFDRAHPEVDLALPGNLRMSAQAWFTPYPMLSIRKAQYVDVDLEQMVHKLGSISPSIAAFLTAAIRAQKNILISGVPGAGKTTLARAILNTLPPELDLAFIETEDELALHELPHRHHRVWAGQELRGGGEVVDGHSAGRLSVDEMMPMALRSDARIIVVGEVRGREAPVMLKAMQAGHTSLSTIHAENGRDTVERLVTCVTEDGGYTTTWAYRQAASLIDIIVHCQVVDERDIGGKEHFYVDEIVLPHLSNDADFSVPALYKAGPDGRAIPDQLNSPMWLSALIRKGFDPTWLTPERGQWLEPLHTIIPTGDPS